jgi:pilus assembly protein CpaB
LKNVAVLANGQKLDRNLLSGESQGAPVITLLVSPDDAQRLALATSQGRIQLALRNPLDTSQSEVAAINAHALYEKVNSTLVSSKPKLRQVPLKPAPVLPSSYPVEVIKGDKRDITKLPD